MTLPQHKEQIVDHIEQALTLRDLEGVLETVSFYSLKQFLIQTINDGNDNTSTSRFFCCSSINEVLPDDIIQKVLLFEIDNDRNQKRAVCKKWNQLCMKQNKIEFRRKCGKIKQLKGDEKEQYLEKEIQRLTVQNYLKQNHLKKKCESLCKNIDQKHIDMVKTLRLLSGLHCKQCKERGSDKVYLVKCKTCKTELCHQCMLKCEAGEDRNECDSEEYYCSEECDQRGECDGCDRELCDYCTKQKKNCDYCSAAVCETCIHPYTKWEDYGSAPWDVAEVKLSLCEECYERRHHDI